MAASEPLPAGASRAPAGPAGALRDLAPAGNRPDPTRTMAAPLRRALTVGAGRTAVVCGEVRLTYAGLAARVRRLIGVLGRHGIGRGDRVAVLGATCHRYLELYLAVPLAGAVLVPLNTRQTDGEHRHALTDSGARLLVTDRAVAGADLPVVELGEPYERELAASEECPERDDLAEGDLAGIFYTGGTTGAAKGVLLTHGNLVANALAFLAGHPFDETTRWLVVPPMFHAAGTIGTLATIWTAGTQVLVPGFGAADVLDLVERERVTGTLLVPTMLDALVGEQRARPREVGSLRLLAHGASPAAVDLLRRTREAFPAAAMMHVYGLTETSPIVTLHPDEQRALDSERARSCGRPAVGVELRVVDPADVPLPAGHIGEVTVRGANVTPGYWNRPEETAAALPAGWFATGDLGLLDEDGFLYLVDRSKDMIITGGENVYSAEVENALYAHPAVVEAAVVGLADERWGETVHAVVTVGAAVAADELVEHCRGRLAGYKVPRSVELRTEPLPKSGAGKILKRRLREEHGPAAGRVDAGR